jgi:hypothetical protein
MILDWPDDGYSIVDGIIVGRIYRELIRGEPKWLGLPQTGVPTDRSCAASEQRYARLILTRRWAR